MTGFWRRRSVGLRRGCGIQAEQVASGGGDREQYGAKGAQCARRAHDAIYFSAQRMGRALRRRRYGRERLTIGVSRDLCASSAHSRTALPLIAWCALLAYCASVARFCCPHQPGRGRETRSPRLEADPAPTHHPTGFPRFCSSSHFFNGSKYSSSAPASIVLSPVIAYNASGHGLLWPSSIIFHSASPAALLL